MFRPRSFIFSAILITPLIAPAQIVTSGSIAVGGGGTLLDGDRPAFQQRFGQKKDGYGGIENFSWSRTTDSSLLRFEARVIPGSEDYRLAARYEKFDAFYVEANYKQFRTLYDGSGGRYLPRDLAVSYFDEDLALDRSYFSFEIGTLLSDAPQWRLRYDRNIRDGTKNSIRWGDSTLAGRQLGPRAFIPSYLVVDEERDIVSAEVTQRSDDANWKLAGRYERTRVNNRHTARRSALEAQDRYVTTHDGTTTEVFSGHGIYERVFHEKLRGTAGGMVTSIDTNLTGSKIYGAAPDSEFSATFARRQPQDVGYYGLVGNTRLKQYVGNLNLVYQPAKLWTILSGVRYEHLRQDSGEGHFDTDFGGGAAPRALISQIEANSRNSWNEVIEEMEVRYTRWAKLSLNARAILNQGTGNLVEQSVLLPARAGVIDRDTDYERVGQRYILNATWYARPGLTFGAQYNYRLKLADYDHLRDNTSTARDRPTVTRHLSSTRISNRTREIFASRGDHRCHSVS